MLVGHDYAVNTDLSVLGVTSPGEPMAGEQQPYRRAGGRGVHQVYLQPERRLVDAIGGAPDQRTLEENRVSTGTPGHCPKGMSRPLEAAPSGSPTTWRLRAEDYFPLPQGWEL
jgi:hypothetical protein